jgi:hypothetical protein
MNMKTTKTVSGKRNDGRGFSQDCGTLREAMVTANHHAWLYGVDCDVTFYGPCHFTVRSATPGYDYMYPEKVVAYVPARLNTAHAPRAFDGLDA